MRIAAIPIATAELGSDGGVIDGCARVHWRGRAMFPAAGDGGGKTTVIYYELKTLIFHGDLLGFINGEILLERLLRCIRLVYLTYVCG